MKERVQLSVHVGPDGRLLSVPVQVGRFRMGLARWLTYLAAFFFALALKAEGTHPEPR